MLIARVPGVFDARRGVHQGDPYHLSVHHSLEILSAAIKNYPVINDIGTDDSEYLLSQYADYSSLILDDNKTSV